MNLHVIQNITGDDYRRLVEFAFEHSDAVMTIYSTSGYNRPFDKEVMEVRAELMPYLLHTRCNADCTPENPYFDWPGTRTGYNDPLDPAAEFFHEDVRLYADTYELTDFVKDHILSINGFFYWTVFHGNSEELAFFKDGACWMFTTAHEGDLYICDHVEEIRSMLDEMGVEYGGYEPVTNKRFMEPYV